MSQLKALKNGNVFPALLSNFFDNDRFLTNGWLEKEFNQSIPALNIKEGANEFNIEFAAPGFKKTDFKITTEENILTISAEKQEEKNEEKKHFTRKEFSYESFSRSIQLPENSKSNKIEAKYEDGILNLVIPKKDLTVSHEKKEIAVA
jgi:HSP20 family protein